MLKKITLIILAVFLAVGITACNKTTTTTTTSSETTTSDSVVALPNLTGANRETITSTLEGLGLTVKYFFDLTTTFTSDSQYDKFVKYGTDLVAGSQVQIGTEVRVYTTPLNLTVQYYPNLDASLQLEEADYQGKEFIEDGIGVVTVNRYTDGDTTQFTSGSETFSVRYLGIDTPESTALYEAWGKAAAIYTENKLKNAETIVLEAEGERQDGNGRYLAWVWYRETAESKFILLNLELVELAYSKNKVAMGSKFTTILTLADWNASLTKRRENFDDYVGMKVVVTGTITRMIANSIFLQDELGYGIYMYGGFTTSAQLQLGVNVTIGALIPTYYSGSPQLSNFNKVNLTVNSSSNIVTPLVVTYNDFTFNRIGTLVTIQDLTVTGMNGAKTSVYVKTALNQTFVVRIDDSTGLNADTLGITVGQIITVTGPLSYYDYDYDSSNTSYVYEPSNFQLMLTSADDLVIEVVIVPTE